MRAPMPLIVRGGLSRTFGSLAAFAALGFLSLGIYLLADAFAHPLDAEAAGLIVAAFAIAIAILLLVFIFRPQKFPEMLPRQDSARISRQETQSPAELLLTARQDRLRSDLPYQRTFVDRSRIQPRTPSPLRHAESQGNNSLPGSFGDEFDAPQ